MKSLRAPGSQGREQVLQGVRALSAFEASPGLDRTAATAAATAHRAHALRAPQRRGGGTRATVRSTAMNLTPGLPQHPGNSRTSTVTQALLPGDSGVRTRLWPRGSRKKGPPHQTELTSRWEGSCQTDVSPPLPWTVLSGCAPHASLALQRCCRRSRMLGASATTRSPPPQRSVQSVWRLSPSSVRSSARGARVSSLLVYV